MREKKRERKKVFCVDDKQKQTLVVYFKQISNLNRKKKRKRYNSN